MNENREKNNAKERNLNINFGNRYFSYWGKTRRGVIQKEIQMRDKWIGYMKEENNEETEIKNYF